jgi:hypothetical protein
MGRGYVWVPVRVSLPYWRNWDAYSPMRLDIPRRTFAVCARTAHCLTQHQVRANCASIAHIPLSRVQVPQKQIPPGRLG